MPYLVFELSDGYLIVMMLFSVIDLFVDGIQFQDGHIDMLSSDHSPSLPELKLFDEGDFLRAWGGISSLQVDTLLFSWLA